MSELNSLLADAQTDAELRSLAIEELESNRSALPKISNRLRQSFIPKHPFADLGCLLEIRPGAGGDEAGIFAFELLKMYRIFCAHHGLRATTLKQEVEDAAEDQLSEGVLEVETPGAYDLLRTESGVHRVQRVPVTETKGRTHTSAVSVMILPSFPEAEGGAVDSELDYENPNNDYYVNPQEVRSEKMRAGGSGGQHVNKTESAVRLTHIPTGITVSMQDSRSQHSNRKKAWQILRAKLADMRREAREQEMIALRRGAMGGIGKMDRGDKVRTYNYGQSRCTDHRSGITVHHLDSVLEGGHCLEEIMASVREWMNNRDAETILSFDQEDVGGSRK